MKKIILCLLFIGTSCLSQQTETEISTNQQTEIQTPQKQRDYNAEAHIMMQLPIKLKSMFTLICFLILVMPGSLFAMISAIYMAMVSTMFYYWPSQAAYVFSAFSGSFILATIFFLILGMIGFLIDLILAFILSKFIPIKRAYYVIWILVFNILSVASFLAIWISWDLLYR